MIGDTSVSRKLGLKVGEWVVVRPSEEILVTLDANARFEELPFMPQMLPHCGKKFRSVSGRISCATLYLARVGAN